MFGVVVETICAVQIPAAAEATNFNTKLERTCLGLCTLPTPMAPPGKDGKDGEDGEEDSEQWHARHEDPVIAIVQSVAPATLPEAELIESTTEILHTQDVPLDALDVRYAIATLTMWMVADEI